jgi:hypothetical protein
MTGGLGTGWRKMGKRGGEADQGPLTMDDLAISGWRLAVSNWRLAMGGWRLAVRDGELAHIRGESTGTGYRSGLQGGVNGVLFVRP